jgi:hypothetical protein
MKFCQNHWNILRKAIDDRGMGHLVAKSGEECVKKLVADIEQPSKSTFDPLMGSHNMILSRALHDYGLEIMMQNEDGSDRCPICFLDAKHKESCIDPGCTWIYEKSWIQGVADDALIEAKRLGLIGDA